MIAEIIKDLKNLRPNVKTLRSFGFLIVGACIVVIVFLFLKRGSFSLATAFIGGFALFITAMRPVLLSPIYFLWMGFALVVGWVITRVFLLIVFYAVMAPMNFLVRLLGKDILDQKIDPSALSYWKKKETVDEVEKYKKMF